jgi:hypothetical protein
MDKVSKFSQKRQAQPDSFSNLYILTSKEVTLILSGFGCTNYKEIKRKFLSASK